MPDALRPTTQLNTKSYLGKALFGGTAPPDPSDPSDGGSDESSRSSTAESEDEPRRHRRRRRRRKEPRTLIKPIPPETYDGSANTRAFHKFVTEATHYLDDGRVPECERVAKLAQFLTAKAYDVYLHRVAYRPEDWELQEFFQALFDDCFPVNFLGIQRSNFDQCKQGNRTVREFVYELNELSMMVGSIDERVRVVRLWKGCVPEIQRELWMKGLNPEVSDFETVAATAEMIELAIGVADRRNIGPKVEGQQQPQNEKQKGNSAHHAGTAKSFPGKGPHGKPGNQDRRSEWKGQRDEKKPFQKRSDSQKGVLTEKEKDELRAEGKCYVCRTAGHIARNCPQRNVIGGTSKSGQAPGVRNNAIRLSAEEMIDIEQLADATESIESLTLGSMSVLFGSENLDEPHELLNVASSELGFVSGSAAGADPIASGEDSDNETIELNYNNGQPGAAPVGHRANSEEGLPRFSTTTLMEDPIGA